MMEKAETVHWSQSIKFESLNLGEREDDTKESFTVSGYNFIKQGSLKTITKNLNYQQLPSNLF